MVGTTSGDTLRTFREACRAAARLCPGVTLYELTEALPLPHAPPPVTAPVTGRTLADVHAPTRVHAATMRDERHRYRVVCRQEGGMVAFTAPARTGSPPREFRDPPVWAGAFERHGLRVLEPVVLATPLDLLGPDVLDDRQRAEVAHRRPHTLGELLFPDDVPVPGPGGR